MKSQEDRPFKHRAMQIHILDTVYYIPLPEPSQNGIKKQSKAHKKNKILISIGEMIPLFPLPQVVASQKLNVSLSTLKRRFSELEMDKWPANYTIDEFQFGRRNTVAVRSQFHRVNTKLLKKNSGYYCMYKEPTMEQKGYLGTLLNEYDTADEKHIDPMTRSILREAFLENTQKKEDHSPSTG